MVGGVVASVAPDWDESILMKMQLGGGGQNGRQPASFQCGTRREEERRGEERSPGLNKEDDLAAAPYHYGRHV